MYTSEPTCKESLTVTQVCHCRATAARRALPPATRPGLALPLIPVLQAKLRQPCPSPARHLAAPRHDSPMRAPAPAAQPVLRALRRGSDRTAPGRRHAPVCRQKARGGSPGSPPRRCGAKDAALREPPDGPGAFSRSSDGAVRSRSLRFPELRRRPRAATPPCRRPRRSAASTPSLPSPRRPGSSRCPPAPGSVADAPAVTVRPRPSRRARRGAPVPAGRSALPPPPRAAPHPPPQGAEAPGAPSAAAPSPPRRAPPRPAGGSGINTAPSGAPGAARLGRGRRWWQQQPAPVASPGTGCEGPAPCPPRTATLWTPRAPDRHLTPLRVPSRPHGLTGPHGNDGGLPLLLHGHR